MPILGIKSRLIICSIKCNVRENKFAAYCAYSGAVTIWWIVVNSCTSKLQNITLAIYCAQIPDGRGYNESHSTLTTPIMYLHRNNNIVTTTDCTSCLKCIFYTLKAGLSSSLIHSQFLKVPGGTLFLVRRCRATSCEGHCVCAPQDQVCHINGSSCNDVSKRKSFSIVVPVYWLYQHTPCEFKI